MVAREGSSPGLARRCTGCGCSVRGARGGERDEAPCASEPTATPSCLLHPRLWFWHDSPCGWWGCSWWSLFKRGMLHQAAQCCRHAPARAPPSQHATRGSAAPALLGAARCSAARRPRADSGSGASRPSQRCSCRAVPLETSIPCGMSGPQPSRDPAAAPLITAVSRLPIALHTAGRATWYADRLRLLPAACWAASCAAARNAWSSRAATSVPAANGAVQTPRACAQPAMLLHEAHPQWPPWGCGSPGPHSCTTAGRPCRQSS